MSKTQILMTDEPIVARSLSVFWFKRVYLGRKFHDLSPGTKGAVLAHEFGHCAGHHTEWRALLWPIGLWLAKQQEFWADAYACKMGYGPELYLHLSDDSKPAGRYHPTNCHRRQKLVHNKLFASPPLRANTDALLA